MGTLRTWLAISFVVGHSWSVGMVFGIQKAHFANS